MLFSTTALLALASVPFTLAAFPTCTKTSGTNSKGVTVGGCKWQVTCNTAIDRSKEGSPYSSFKLKNMKQCVDKCSENLETGCQSVDYVAFTGVCSLYKDIAPSTIAQTGAQYGQLRSCGT